MATTSGEMTAHPLVESYLGEEDANRPWYVPNRMNSICFELIQDCNCCEHICCIVRMDILGCLTGRVVEVGIEDDVD